MKLLLCAAMLSVFLACRPHKTTSNLQGSEEDKQRAALMDLIAQKSGVVASVDDRLTIDEYQLFTSYFNDPRLVKADFASFQHIFVEPKVEGRTSGLGMCDLASRGLVWPEWERTCHLFFNAKDLPNFEAFQRKTRFMAGANLAILAWGKEHGPVLAPMFDYVDFDVDGLGEKYGAVEFATDAAVAEKLQAFTTLVEEPLKKFVTETLVSPNLRKVSGIKLSAAHLEIMLLAKARPQRSSADIPGGHAASSPWISFDVTWDVQQLNAYFLRLDEHIAKGRSLLKDIHETTGKTAESAYTDFEEETLMRLATLSKALKDVKPLVGDRLAPAVLELGIHKEPAYDKTWGGFYESLGKTYLTLSVDDATPEQVPGYFGAFVAMGEQKTDQGSHKVTFSTWNYHDTGLTSVVCAMPVNKPHTCVGAPTLSKASQLVDPKQPSRALWVADTAIDLTKNPSLLFEVSGKKGPMVRQGFSFGK